MNHAINATIRYRIVKYINFIYTYDSRESDRRIQIPDLLLAPWARKVSRLCLGISSILWSVNATSLSHFSILWSVNATSLSHFSILWSVNATSLSQFSILWSVNATSLSQFSILWSVNATSLSHFSILWSVNATSLSHFPLSLVRKQCGSCTTFRVEWFTP